METTKKPDIYDYTTHASRFQWYFTQLRHGPALRLYSTTNVWYFEDSTPDAILFSTTRENKTYYLWVFSKYNPSGYELLVEKLRSGEITTVKVIAYNDNEWIAVPDKVN